MNPIVPYNFTFETAGVRAVLIDEEPWFIARDVATALELAQPHKAYQRLDADEKGEHIVLTPGGPQEMTIVSEPGVYQLVFTSRTTKAKAFKRWLAHEVLPALRRTGAYVMGHGAVELPLSADGKLWGVGVAKVNAAARMIGVASKIYGPEAARRLYELEPGLPILGDYSVGALAGSAKDDPAGCLRFLLSLAVGSGLSIGDVLHNSLHDPISAATLKDLGILVAPDGFDRFVAVANAHAWLARSFIETQWQGDWRLALARLPGARPSPGNYRFGKAYSKAVLIPRDVVLDARGGIRH